MPRAGPGIRVPDLLLACEIDEERCAQRLTGMTCTAWRPHVIDARKPGGATGHQASADLAHMKSRGTPGFPFRAMERRRQIKGRNLVGVRPLR